MGPAVRFCPVLARGWAWLAVAAARLHVGHTQAGGGGRQARSDAARAAQNLRTGSQLPPYAQGMPVSGRCPNCGGEFAELERAGVRIDACRSCRGVWLDRGELEQLVERESRVVEGASHDDEDFVREITGRGRRDEHREHRRDHDDDDHRGSKPAFGLDAQTATRIFQEYSSHQKKRGKKKSLLGELLG